MSTRMSVLGREVSEAKLPKKNSGTTLPYRTQSVSWAPEQWMPNTLLSGVCTVRKTVPQGHHHVFVRMWRLRHPAAMLRRGKQEKMRACQPFVKKWKICSIRNENAWGGGLTAMHAPSRSSYTPFV